MDCSLPGSSVHGIFQAGVLEWGAIAFSASKMYCVSKFFFPPMLTALTTIILSKGKEKIIRERQLIKYKRPSPRSPADRIFRNYRGLQAPHDIRHRYGVFKHQKKKKMSNKNSIVNKIVLQDQRTKKTFPDKN